MPQRDTFLLSELNTVGALSSWLLRAHFACLTGYHRTTGGRIAEAIGHLQHQCDLLASRKRSHRSTSSRRSAPWNGSAHPGYSGGRALTSSNCLSSSWVSVSSTAARLS